MLSKRLLITKPLLIFFWKYLFLFTLLFACIASAALQSRIAAESNPFLYAKF